MEYSFSEDFTEEDYKQILIKGIDNQDKGKLMFKGVE